MENFIQKLLSSAFYISTFGLVVGFIFALIPRSALERLEVFFKLRNFEQNGTFYTKYFKINLWKDKLPQFSEITKFGFNKSSLSPISSEYLNLFKLETIRAELTHLILILASPIYLIVESKIILPLTVIGNIIGNIPFIMIQRFNRARIKRLLSHFEKAKQ